MTYGASARRAWPGPDGTLAVEIVDGTGGVVVPDRDPRLPTLTRRAAEPGTVVIGYRPGKRAVLRQADGTYLKLARPSATARALERAVAVEHALVGVVGAPHRPPVLGGDADAGEIRLGACAGRPLTDLWLAGPAVAATASREVAAALAGVARGSTDGLPVHTARDEAAVVDRWVGDALAYGVVPGELGAVRDEVTERLLTGPAAPVALCHRDVHDGQVLLDGDQVTFLDWDTSATAEVVLDVGNLLAHLDLLDVLVPSAGEALAAAETALLDGLAEAGHPAADHLDRVADYRLAARVRLVAVHAFRPHAGRAVAGLLRTTATMGR